jgi:hypothetical protein
MAHFRCPTAGAGGHGEWISLIRQVNRIAPDTFGKPEVGPWWAGGSVEEYPDARVIHRGDDSISVVSKTERGDQLIREAARST